MSVRACVRACVHSCLRLVSGRSQEASAVGNASLSPPRTLASLESFTPALLRGLCHRTAPRTKQRPNDAQHALRVGRALDSRARLGDVAPGEAAEGKGAGGNWFMRMNSMV